MQLEIRLGEGLPLFLPFLGNAVLWAQRASGTNLAGIQKVFI